MPNIKVSLVVPTFNRRDVLSETLRRLSRQSLPASDFELLVIDDCSEDGTWGLVTGLDLPARLTYLRNSTNLGRAKTRNRGIRQAKGGLVLLLDDDIWADEELVEQHVEAHKLHGPNTVVAGAIRVAEEVPKTVYNEYLSRHHAWCLEEMRKHSECLPSNFCKTANLSMSRDLIVSIGLFDERFTTYGGEDTDLGYRLWQHGARFVFCEEAVGWHYHNESLESITSKAAEAARSVLLFNHLHPEWKRQGDGFFTPYYQKARGFKELRNNILKFFVLRSVSRMMNKWAVQLLANPAFSRALVSKYLLPVLRMQYLAYGLRIHTNANRD